MVTIGIPVYNAERWLREALDSVLGQSYVDWELIVTDDGSTDGSVEIAREYLNDPRVRLIADGEHRGISYRINQQVALARGEFFARMDADDVMIKDRLMVQMQFMLQHPEVDVCGTAAGKWTFVHPSVMGRTAWFCQHPYRSECDGCEDWDLWLRTKDSSTFGYIDTPILFYREPEKRDKQKYLLRRQQGRVAIRMNRNLLPAYRYYALLMDSYLKSAYAMLFY